LHRSVADGKRGELAADFHCFAVWKRERQKREIVVLNLEKDSRAGDWYMGS